MRGAFPTPGPAWIRDARPGPPRSAASQRPLLLTGQVAPGLSPPRQRLCDPAPHLAQSKGCGSPGHRNRRYFIPETEHEQ